MSGGWEWLVTINGYRACFGGYENVVKLKCDDACIIVNILKTSEVHTFKSVNCMLCELHLSNFLRNPCLHRKFGK